MKSQRQQVILEIVSKYDIATQEELIAKLAEIGYDVTQTTISRDIRQLKLVKSLSRNGVYKYVMPGTMLQDGKRPILNETIASSIMHVEAAQNLVIVKTTPGMANAVAICVESIDLPHIVGTIAGDDTLLLVMKDNSSAEEVENKLRLSLGD